MSTARSGRGFLFALTLFLGRFGSTLRNIALAGVFGATLQTDSFRLSFQTPQWLFLILSSAAIGNAFSSVFSGFLANKKIREAWDLYSVILTILISVGAAFLLFGFVGAPILCRMLAPGKPEDSVAQLREMTQILLPAQWCLSLGGLLYAALYARQKMSVPGLSEAILAIGALCGVLLGAVTGQIESVAFGVLAGALFGSVLLPAIALRGMGVLFRPSLDLNREGVREVLTNIVGESIAFGMPLLLMITVQIFGTYFKSGSNTLLEYAGQIALLPIVLFGIPFANVMSPTLEQFKANHRPDLSRSLLGRLMGSTFFLVLPLTAMLIALAPYICRALFGHGAFDQAQSAQCADLLRVFSIGMLGWALQPLLTRALISAGQMSSAAMLSLCSPVLMCVLTVALSSKHTPLTLLPFAVSISALIVTIFLFLAVCRSYGNQLVGPALASLAKSILCAGVAGGVVFGLSLVLADYLRGSWLIPMLLVLLLGGFWLNLGIGRLLKMKEAEYAAAGLGG